MKLQPFTPAPDFLATDVARKSVRLSDLRGAKVLLSFYRNAGCPVCNLRYHELAKAAPSLASRGLVMVAVYESSAENLAQYLEGLPRYATMIGDTAQTLYRLYGIERSMGKMMAGMGHGAMGKMRRGKKLFSQKVKQDGHADRIGADFLIDETGRIVVAHYGRYLGDAIPVAEIEAWVQKATAPAGE
jgi:peroxiredoxin